MVKVAIISDDTCDLPMELLEEYNITLVPVKVIFSDRVFCSCGVAGELTLEEYYKRAEQELPTTSQPSPGAIVQAFEKAFQIADEVIAIFISQYMSPIANTTRRIVEQYFPDKKISIYDSQVTSVGLAIVVLEAARLAKEGYSREEINDHIKVWLEQIHFTGIMCTLENLVRTGRVPKAKKYLADFFKIKPIVKFIDGQVSVRGKIRADDSLILSQMKKFGKKAIEHMDGESEFIFIGHTRWPSAAEEIKAYLENYNTQGKKIIIQETGAIVANYVGQKTLTFGYLGKFNDDWFLNTKEN